ncbi:tetratricopeptide repeat protein [Methanocalculus sp.]|uniref:tetratricopeptide repeat protein n=1 Tax=Methanocalculus sp. TaxID=2004547 RepID=UPI00262B7522|nr:tetratricopeptide repeat protein [Methanocalculus sp.]MDG6249555.1 tetratricopeptide repeat protein [Methanocalculus sp.]
MFSVLKDQIKKGDQINFFFIDGSTLSGHIDTISDNYLLLNTENGKTTITKNEVERNIGRWTIIGNINSPTSGLSHKGDLEAKISDSPDHTVDSFLGDFETEIKNTKVSIFDPIYSSPFPRGSNNRQNENWNRINNGFQHAKKSNQLGSISGLIKKLDLLAGENPKLSVIPYNSGCFSYFLRDYDAAIAYFSTAFNIEKNPKYLHNLLVSSLEKHDYSTGIKCLYEIFSEKLPWEMDDEWHLYIFLTYETNSYKQFLESFQKIIIKISSRKISVSSTQSSLLFKTIVLLLKKNKQLTEALAVIDLFKDGSDLSSKTLNLMEISFKSTVQQKTQENLSVNQKEEEKLEIIHEKNESLDIEEEISLLKNGKSIPVRGRIYSYKSDRNYGFIADDEGVEYFFHRSAIIDNSVLFQLSNVTWSDEISIDVIFEKTNGPRGPIAIEITSLKTNDELLTIANEFANNGDYVAAISNIKQILFVDSKNSKARELFILWRKYLRFPNLPLGDNSFAKAIRAQIAEKDIRKAEYLFLDAIQEKDNLDNAVIELATLYCDENRNEEAIQLLKKHIKRIKSPRHAEELLAVIYRRTEQYDSLITLLENHYNKAQSNIEKGQILLQMGNSYLHLNNYEEADKTFIRVLDILPDNLSARRNRAICLYKQNKFNEAEAILSKILEKTYDASAVDLKNAISDARKTGQSSSQLEEIITVTVSSDYSNEETTEFTKYLLENFDISGIFPNRMLSDTSGKNTYSASEKEALIDIQIIEKTIRSIKATNSREIANYYLAAAWICSKKVDDRNKFYEYLAKAFTYSGDSAVQDNRSIDAIKSWYCEALIAFDNIRQNVSIENIALDNVCKFIYSTLGKKHIPLSNTLPLNIVLDDIFTKSPSYDLIFDAIGYLIFRSEFASKKILGQIFNKPKFREKAIQFLKNKGVNAQSSIEDLNEFVSIWNDYRRNLISTNKKIKNDFQYFQEKQFSLHWLEDISNKIPKIIEEVYFKEDMDRLHDLKNVIDNYKDLFDIKTFEEKERILIQISNNCKSLINEIQDSPTQISIMGIIPLAQYVKLNSDNDLNMLYQTSSAGITVRLAVPSYFHHNQDIEIQLAVENQIGCSPADSIVLIPAIYDDDLFGFNERDMKIPGTLRGGTQKIVKIPLSLSDNVINARNFSFSVYLRYKCYSGEIKNTQPRDINIQVYPENEFQEINNPYSQYAVGTIVTNKKMFYGRNDLIKNIFTTIQNSRDQSKCIIIFGQKRSGKSSILYHLKILLKDDPSLIILDLGSLGSIIVNSETFVYNLFWSILRKLKDALVDIEESNNLSKIVLAFPTVEDFFAHPSPEIKFMEIFDNFNRVKEKTPGWSGKRVVLLIDEFSYLYNDIATGRIPKTFMKLWKALLERNYFGAVLVGQDVMEKFKSEFPNEFGVIQDERVSYLSEEDSIKLIDEPIQINGKTGLSRYKEKAIHKIIDLTAGNPFFIQIICDKLVFYMNHTHKNFITEADVGQVKQDLIAGVNAFDLATFDNLISSGDESPTAIKQIDIVNVLRAIATNSQNGFCQRSAIDIVTDTSIDEILDELVERNVIVRKKNNQYDIKVKLFKEWLIAHP